MAENSIFSYTKRDYESSRQEGLAKIPVLSKGQWTDLNASDPGIIILDYVHALVDMINYYQDHQALETFITTAKERANIFRLAKQLSYEIRSAKGATCEVEFTTTITFNETIRIPKYTSVSTNSGISYLTSQDAYLLAGEHRVIIPCVQGKLNEITYQGTGISRFSAINNAANQTIRLVDNNIDMDSIVIKDNLDRLWESVEYVIFSTNLDRAYQVELNPDNSISIKFGDGERGIVPKDTDILSISYISTLGEDGRVSENQLVVLDDMIFDDNGNYISFTVNNISASSGGSFPQTSQEIRETAPGAIKAQDRAVTLNDFENLARLVDGVKDAKAYDINTKPDLCLYHEVKLLVTPKDNSVPHELLRDNVYNYLSRRMVPPTNLQVLTPSYIDININIVVKKLENVNEGRLSYAVQQVVKDFFNDRVGSVGEPFYPSDLITIISKLSDVRSIVSITPNDTVQVEDFSVLRLGNLNISVV